MQPEQGTRLENGAGRVVSPLSLQPGALVQDMTCTNLRSALGTFAYWSSINQNLSEDPKKYSMPCWQTHCDERYLRKHIIAKSFLDTQMVAGLKAWQRREGGEFSKPAHWIELALPGCGRAWCVCWFGHLTKLPWVRPWDRIVRTLKW